MDSATFAIFFSIITSIFLQSTKADSSGGWTIVYLCWFASLVLSIASAANNFLGAVIHQSPTILCRPNTAGRRFVKIWLSYFPTILLAISALLFLAGLCSFTFSSSNAGARQGQAIEITTTSLTGIAVTALFVISTLAFKSFV
ncbi:hypothetical protein SCHPADRAFT_934961 [Schizopora paradoxa]|uniref:Uncharacterized protein n=1 Tax=Schizopora paradoxa TaxID=27342 RepID=A0A0H2S786_9AGAM|nr:hypothetical protein SCHPADRAFT_934961 [Schizopora paradoxa]